MIGWLLLGVLLLPTGGAIVARLLSGRVSTRVARAIAVLGFAGAIAGVLILQQTPVDAATLGRLSIFLPSRAIVVSQESYINLPTVAPVALAPTAAATVFPTTTPTTAPTATPTIEPTAPIQPSPAAPPPTEPPPPTEAPPQPTAAPAPTQAPAATPAPRRAQRYVVQAGDTLRSIAARFDVSVDALIRYNGLTAEEADSLRVGQELLIPPP